MHASPIGAPAPLILLGALLIFCTLFLRFRSGGARRVPTQRSRLSVWGIGLQFLAFVAVGAGDFRIVLASSSTPAVVQAAVTFVLAAATCAIFGAAKHALGKNWSLVARTRADHELVTSGPFAQVRHPIYSALFLWLIAVAVAFGHYLGLILGMPLFGLGTVLRVREEERLLRARFTTDYDHYAARVKRFVPGIV